MSEINFEVARFNMVQQQIRPWDVLDERVLDLVGRMPREDFVPPAFRKLAFADMNIPLGRGEVMMAPKVEARLLQELEISPQDKILEVGTGSGYLTALLAALGGHVHSIEIVPEFSAQAAATLAARRVNNTTLEVGDAARGWERHQPYDVIAITGSVPMLSDNFRNSLKVGGRLFAIVGQSPVMEAKLIRRVDQAGFSESSLFETLLPPLRNAPAPSKFVF